MEQRLEPVQENQPAGEARSASPASLGGPGLRPGEANASPASGPCFFAERGRSLLFRSSISPGFALWAPPHWDPPPDHHTSHILQLLQRRTVDGVWSWCHGIWVTSELRVCHDPRIRALRDILSAASYASGDSQGFQPPSELRQTHPMDPSRGG
jgi:hypothetical protein